MSQVRSMPFDMAAHRVHARYKRMFPDGQRSVQDVKNHWYYKGTPWVQRERFGK